MCDPLLATAIAPNTLTDSAASALTTNLSQLPTIAYCANI